MGLVIDGVNHGLFICLFVWSVGFYFSADSGTQRSTGQPCGVAMSPMWLRGARQQAVNRKLDS